tara:strand:- start:22042 stop:22539 length:498 start_codon:yes stop_codon:yes gene_type:complete
MSSFQSQSIEQDKFLLMSANLMHKTFIEAARTDAKNVYKLLADGKPVHLTTVQMEDKSTLRCNLSLDPTEFCGKLNYGAFRASVATLIANVTQSVRDAKEVPVFNPQEGEGTTIFGVTAVTVEDEKPNVMVLGADFSRPGDMMLTLMYLDPQQFAVTDGAGRSEA